MIARAWTILSGLPAGALAALGLREEAGPGTLAAGALVGGLGLALLASWLARRAGDPGARRRLAAAACWGWVALPALGAALLGVQPGPGSLLLAVLLLLSLALARAARAPHGGPGAAGIGARAVLAAGFGGLAIVFVASLLAARHAQTPPVSAERAAAVYELDAAVVTRALPQCRPRPRRVETLLEVGAHPRLSSDGSRVWFDAADASGQRQIQRLDLESGRVVCWTCAEPGHNVRPAPGAGDRLVAFETDRWVSWRRPADSEIHVIDGRGDAPSRPSRRLTLWPGADEHPTFGPDGPYLVWSRSTGGRYAVVGASVLSGHGGLTMGAPGVLLAGGAEWVAPLAWSPDARALVIAHGNPLAASELAILDPATGDRRPLQAGAGRAACFGADGGWMAAATAAGAGLAARLPAGLGFLLAPRAVDRTRHAPLHASGGVRVGATERGLQFDLELGEAAAWGELTGLALSADAASLVLGQRRAAGSGVQERLLRVELDCDVGSRPPGGEA